MTANAWIQKEQMQKVKTTETLNSKWQRMMLQDKVKKYRVYLVFNGQIMQHEEIPSEVH